MSGRIVGAVVSGAGLVCAGVFSLADILGIGQNPTRFGTAQTVGTIVGVLILIVGLIILLFGEAPGSTGEQM